MRKLATLAAVAIFAIACGNGNGNGNGNGEQADATPEPTPPQAVRSTEDRLPEDFPEDFPLPEQRTVVFSQTAGQTTLVYFDTPMPDDDLGEFYKAQLPRSGWTIQACQETSTPEPVLAITTVKQPTWSIVTVGRLPDGQQGFEGDYKFFVALVEPATQPEVSSPQPCPQ